MDKPYFLKLDEVASYLGIGRTKVYELIRSGRLASVLVGGRSRRVSKAALELYVAATEEEQQSTKRS